MTEKAVKLLKQLIATPSLSRQEAGAADVVECHLRDEGMAPERVQNCVYAWLDEYRPSRPTLMLNSHLDTVKPSPSYTFDPFTPFVSEGRLYGLGSNDAGASVVSLMVAFTSLKGTELPFNLLLALTAEEEVMGTGGMRLFLPHLQEHGVNIDCAIVGEPTGMQAAVAERGLLVLDCAAYGIAGHAARNEGVNALYKAIDDIVKIRSLQLPVSDVLGPVKISVTMIESGSQHNVVPDLCKFVADVRTTDSLSNEEVFEEIRRAVSCDVTPRSTHIRASVINDSHPLVAAATELGATTFVSPTTSDMALMPFPSLKIGPGDSARSHTADEYICINEIEEAIPLYRKLILKLNETLG